MDGSFIGRTLNHKRTAAACSALVRRCDVCGIINAIDLDPTPARWKEMQLIDHTVLTVPQAEAMKLWDGAGRCDHKKFIAGLRAQVHSCPNHRG